MEDDPAEWAIQEYSPYSKQDKSFVSMVKWILEKGYGIGKNVVIIGVAMPIVVPPLIVFSAMGYVFSVPFGFGFATYACTDKIIATLLPSPLTQPEYYDQQNPAKSMFELDDGGGNYSQIEQGCYIDEYDVDSGVQVGFFVSNVDGDEVENEEDVFGLENVAEDENVFELDDHGEASIMNVVENVDEESNLANENVDESEMPHREKEQMEDIKQGVETRLGLDMSGEDQGYEKDAGDYLEGDDDSFEDESKGEEPLIESEIDENKSNTTENEMEESGDGLSENIRDEGSVNNTFEDGYLLDECALVFEDARDVEITKPVMVKEIDSQKPIMDGSTNTETVVGEMRHIVILAQGNNGNNHNVREVEEVDLVAREVMGDTNKKETNTKSAEQVMRESMGTKEEKTFNEDAILRKKNEQTILSYADAREIGDESGLDLLDERNTNIHFASLEADDEWKENENVDFVALPAFKPTPLATENGKATIAKMPSREDGLGLGEEGIWEKMEAMRRIVGYKAPKQPACIRELKALYVFTGVDPPASFKDDSDLDEVNANLKFLMSIVGVK